MTRRKRTRQSLWAAERRSFRAGRVLSFVADFRATVKWSFRGGKFVLCTEGPRENAAEEAGEGS